MGSGVLDEAGSGHWRSAASPALLLIRCFSEFVGSASASDSWHMAPVSTLTCVEVTRSFLFFSAVPDGQGTNNLLFH